MHIGQAVIFVGVGALIVALSIPLIRRRIHPNSGYGLRVPATFADESVWYDANAKFGRDLRVYGVLLIIVPAALAALPISEDAFAASCVVLALGGALVVSGVGWRRANRLLRERRASRAGVSGGGLLDR